jgi:hypothetical protein
LCFNIDSQDLIIIIFQQKARRFMGSFVLLPRAGLYWGPVRWKWNGMDWDGAFAERMGTLMV